MKEGFYMKTTVFFDLGNVLLFFSLEKMFQQIAELTDLPLIDIQQLIISEGWGLRYEKGEITTNDLLKRLQYNSTRTITLSALIDAATQIFKPNTSLFPLIEGLKKQGIKLFLLSNTNEAHFRYAYTHYPFLHLFDGYVLSFEVGAVKPEQKIFNEALKIASCTIEECFYVDDIPEYVQAAQLLGLDSEIFTTKELLLLQLQKRKLLPIASYS